MSLIPNKLFLRTENSVVVYDVSVNPIKLILEVSLEVKRPDHNIFIIFTRNKEGGGEGEEEPVNASATVCNIFYRPLCGFIIINVDTMTRRDQYDMRDFANSTSIRLLGKQVGLYDPFHDIWGYAEFNNGKITAAPLLKDGWHTCAPPTGLRWELYGKLGKYLMYGLPGPEPLEIETGHTGNIWRADPFPPDPNKFVIETIDGDNQDDRLLLYERQFRFCSIKLQQKEGILILANGDTVIYGGKSFTIFSWPAVQGEYVLTEDCLQLERPFSLPPSGPPHSSSPHSSPSLPSLSHSSPPPSSPPHSSSPPSSLPLFKGMTSSRIIAAYSFFDLYVRDLSAGKRVLREILLPWLLVDLVDLVFQYLAFSPDFSRSGPCK